MSDKTITNIPDPENDILFTCDDCGKSLVINVQAAGMLITCPDCGSEQQVPALGQYSEEATDNQAGDDEDGLPEISDVLTDAREQIVALSSEIEELQLRRSFLEKHRALANQTVQSLRRNMELIRTALENMDEDLRALEEQSALDPQQPD